jgi:hypothetical protein
LSHRHCHRGLAAWLEQHVYVDVERPEASPTDILYASLREPLPLALNVEVGAYINAIRSGLDIAAASVALRHDLDGTRSSFPIAASAEALTRNGTATQRFLKMLPPKERAIIEGLKPYKGGNSDLWALHYLDNVRKHRRLLDVDMRPLAFSITGWNLGDTVTPIKTGYMISDEKVVLGLLTKGAEKPQVRFTGRVTVDEPEIGRKQVIPLLTEFARLAKSIIALFNN